MINLLITGYHGYGNCGDEATLRAMTTNIKGIADDVSITAISHIPMLTKEEYQIKSVQRFHPWAVLHAILKSDIILSGGGTLLQNGTSTRSLLYYLSIIFIGKLFRKRVMLYSNGIGPVTGAWNRKLVKWVVNRVDFITLREEFSKADLMDMGVVLPKIVVTADAAFTLKSAEESHSEEILRNENIKTDKPLIGVSVRNWHKAKSGESFLQEIAKACDVMIEKGKAIVFIPMEQPKDVEAVKKVVKLMKQKPYILKKRYKPNEILGIIGLMDVVLGMRLHALLFSAQKKVPILGIVYDSKIEYYLNVLDMPSVGDINKETLQSEKIVEKLQEILENSTHYVGILDEKVEHLMAAAGQNEVYLAEQLEMIRKEKHM
ncbi:MAG: polysaccharide pyruvyl transferase CsaB [Bacillota bacterium]